MFLCLSHFSAQRYEKVSRNPNFRMDIFKIRGKDGNKGLLSSRVVKNPYNQPR